MIASLLIGVAAVFAIGDAGSTTSPSTELGAALTDVVERRGIHGAIAVHVEPDHEPTIVVLGGLGPDDVVRVGSISKLVTSTMIMRLVEAGALTLDDEVQVVDVSSPCTEPLRLVHLLEHTGGLAGSSFRDYATQSHDIAPSTWVQTLAPLELRWCPGRLFSYANTGHTVAAAMAEQATGDSFDALVRAQVFEPLGLRSATYSTADGVAVPSHGVGGAAVEPWAMPFRPSGALAMDAHDLARLLAMFVSRGEHDGRRFLREDSLARMERGESSVAARAGIGDTTYGLGTFAFIAGGRLFRGHWGKTDGFVTRIGWLPEARAGFALVLDTADVQGAAEMTELLAAHVGRALPVVAPPPASTTIDDLDGLYLDATHDIPLRAWLFELAGARWISSDGDGVHVRSIFGLGASRRLVPVTSTTFREVDLPVATIAVVDDDGERYWVEQDASRRVSTPIGLAWIATAVLGTLAAAVAMLRGVVHLLLRIGRRVRGRPSAAAGPRALHTAGTAATLTISTFVAYGLLGDAAVLGRPGFVALAVLLGSVVFPIAGVVAGVHAWRSPARGPAAWSRRVEAVLLLGLAAIWAHAGWIPLVTWR